MKDQKDLNEEYFFDEEDDLGPIIGEAPAPEVSGPKNGETSVGGAELFMAAGRGNASKTNVEMVAGRENASNSSAIMAAGSKGTTKNTESSVIPEYFDEEDDEMLDEPDKENLSDTGRVASMITLNSADEIPDANDLGDYSSDIGVSYTDEYADEVMNKINSDATIPIVVPIDMLDDMMVTPNISDDPVVTEAEAFQKPNDVPSEAATEDYQKNLQSTNERENGRKTSDMAAAAADDFTEGNRVGSYDDEDEERHLSPLAIALLSLGGALLIAGIGFGTYFLLDARKAAKIYDEARDNAVTQNSPDAHATENPDEDFVIDMGDDGKSVISGLGQDELEDDSYDDSKNVKATGNKDYTFRYTGKWYEQADFELDEVMKKYPEVNAWLFFENEDINYPIVQAKDDIKYLDKAYTGEKSRAGSIFLEALNTSNYQDAHTLIYGHNMDDRSMFGALTDYMYERNYYKYHKYFQIVTHNKEGKQIKYRYRVFAFEETEPDSLAFTVCKSGGVTYHDVLEYIKDNSYIDAKLPVGISNKVVTLSTCVPEDMRFIVSGVLVDSYTEE